MQKLVWQKNEMCQEQKSNPRFPIKVGVCYHYTIEAVDLGRIRTHNSFHLDEVFFQGQSSPLNYKVRLVVHGIGIPTVIVLVVLL